MTTPVNYSELIQPKGAAYKRVKSKSYYNDPIDRTNDRAAGNSRIWGDASESVQKHAIDVLIKASQQAGLDTRQTAHVLAIARVESGFNPDAAAGTTSAHGLGQFVYKTGESYGIDDSNRYDIEKQADVLVEHFKDNLNLAQSRGKSEAYVYKYHHDGPSADDAGLGISKKDVAPYIDKYEKFVKAHEQQYGKAEVDQQKLNPPKRTVKKSSVPIKVSTKELELVKLQISLPTDIKVNRGQIKAVLELGEHLKSHSFDNLKDVQKLEAFAKTAKIELVTPAEAILADKEKINLTNKADITALQNVLFERGLITSPSRGIFGAQTKNALVKEFDLPQNHTFGNELAAEHLEKLNAKTVEAIQAKIDLVLPKLQKNQSTMENKMIEINKAIAALEAERIALNDPTIENYLEAQHAAKVAEAAEVEIENPQNLQNTQNTESDLAQLQDDLVLKEMFIAELEQRIANLTALTAQVPDQSLEKIEKIEKPDIKIDLLEVENKEILLTMTATGMSFNINGKDYDASYFNQLQVGITDTQSTYRNENNTLLAKYEYESDQFSIFHKNPYTADKIAVISDFSQQNTINLVSFDAVINPIFRETKKFRERVLNF